MAADVVMYLHDQSIRAYGGYHGVRDAALLASALNRPHDKLDYNCRADFPDLAAAYAFGIAKNHAFIDGNKRTAWAVCVLFLKLNGIEVSVPPDDVVETMVALATSAISEADFARWLSRGCQPVPT
ncbi:MAG: type II toxin-antitoxin system death-on-curing family toxin [Acidocella sp.]|nr:type II toxin-antitoxin system death-on-curing family toxin [Acidocella sp.]